MKLTDKQYYSLIAVMCAMVIGFMALAFYFAPETMPSGTDTGIDTDTEDGIVTITVEAKPKAAETTEIVEETTITEEATKEIIEESTTVAETTVNEPETTDTVQWSDVDLIARCVWAEARGESYAGQVAVAEVILNRVKHRDFPDTVYDVIYERGQFVTASSLPYATPSETQYNAVYDAMGGRGVLNNPNCVYFSVGRSCGTYYTTIGNHVFGCEF